ncbi:MAG: hypothetical protein QNJ09_03845 [Paracoccaceae bacterium]|nr:hypothetical protein [Paracoccaceae bacterium]
MKIIIGTPTAGGTVTTAYARSLTNLTLELSRLKAAYALAMIDGSDIIKARNIIASEALADPACTHVLFLDSDMDVPRAVFQRLLEAGHDLAGAIYPKRQLDLDRYTQLIREGVRPEQARAASSEFVVGFSSSQITVQSGWCKATVLGTGCLLIKRNVLEALASGGQVAQIASSLPEGGPLYDFFGPLSKPDGARMSEDFSFCVKATQAGFTVWALADADVGHMGTQRYTARFSDHLAYMSKRS